jgi:hypothetical protein
VPSSPLTRRSVTQTLPAQRGATPLSSTFHRRFVRLLSGHAIIDGVNPFADPSGTPNRLRRVWRPTARTAVAIIAAAGLAVVAASCGGSRGSQVAELGSTATRSISSNSAEALAHGNGWLAFSRCMRSHGVAKFPDPASGGELPKVSLQQLGVSSSQFQAAQTACQSLRPTGGSLQQRADCLMLGNCPQVLVQQMLTAERKYARCMRSHAVPSWPDPTINSQGMPVFNITEAGIDRQFIHSSLFRSPNSECQRLTGGAPVPRA